MARAAALAALVLVSAAAQCAALAAPQPASLAHATEVYASLLEGSPRVSVGGYVTPDGFAPLKPNEARPEHAAPAHAAQQHADVAPCGVRRCWLRCRWAACTGASRGRCLTTRGPSKTCLPARTPWKSWLTVRCGARVLLLCTPGPRGLRLRASVQP